MSSMKSVNVGKSYILKVVKMELERWLRTRAAFAEDACLVPSTHMTSKNWLQLQFSRSDGLFWPLRALGMHIHACRQVLIHIKIN